MNRFAVVGLGSFGLALARALARLGAEVTAVDNDMAHVDLVKDDVQAAVSLDARDRAALEQQGVHRVDTAVVCMGEDFEAAEVAALHLQELGCPRVVVRGTSNERVEILKALGPEVITPGSDAARTLAVKLLGRGLSGYESFPGEHDVAMVDVGEDSDGVTLLELLGKGHGCRALAVRRGDRADAEVITAPGDSTRLRAGDHIFLMGTEKQLIRLGERL
jgi:trk system potassium uptake protein TrkA